MPNLESHLDTVVGARYITVCDVQNAYHQTPVAASEQDKQLLSRRTENGYSNDCRLVSLMHHFSSRE